MEILANNFRPKLLNDIIGQSHLIGEGKILTNLIKNKKVFSMILYGKPGVGKTSIANVIVNELDMPHKFLNATINNKADFDYAINEARMSGNMILIIDEIQRMNKDKQDLLLPYIENGLIILIGLTTANPYYKINPAIRSRVQIFELKDLTLEEIKEGLKKATGLLENINIDDDALNYIVNLANGDFRFALNLLEIAYYSSSNGIIDIELLKTINNKPAFVGDNNEEGHYDLLSALQKSIRGSDIDASIHYLARLIEMEDLDSVYRRLSVIAYEDIGLANPNIGPRLYAAIKLSELVGLPEARIILGEIVSEMALSPKSNSAYLAITAALNDIRLGYSGNIPDNIKINSKNYVYPHNYPKSYVKQNYLPDKIKDKRYYSPKNNNVEKLLYKIYQETRNEL